MKRKYPLVAALLSLTIAFGAQAQTTSVNYVTEVVTDYGGWWRSGNGASPVGGVTSAGASTTRPDNSHNLLAFVANGVRYSTGVNDVAISNQGLSFTAARFNSLPVEALSTPNANTKGGFGQLYDGIDNGASNPPPARTLAWYLVDGQQGLNIGTGLANIPAGSLEFTLNGIQTAAVGDGTPDLLVTQIAQPSGTADVYSFLDNAGNVVGNSVSVVYNGSFPVVGQWTADFYDANSSPMTLNSGFTKTARDLRLWTADLSQFGITAANASQIKRLRVQLNGDSDLAFVAYNTQSARLLPVELTDFGARATAEGNVRLSWRTASERNAEVFIVEASHDGGTFGPVGEVAAAGNSTSPRDYAFGHRPGAAGTWYYRLRQRDFDGKETLSEIRTVQLGKTAGLGALQLLPNPARGRVQVLNASTEPVVLLDATGRTLRQATATGVLELEGLPAGIYLVRNGSRSARLVVE